MTKRFPLVLSQEKTCTDVCNLEEIKNSYLFFPQIECSHMTNPKPYSRCPQNCDYLSGPKQWKNIKIWDIYCIHSIFLDI